MPDASLCDNCGGGVFGFKRAGGLPDEFPTYQRKYLAPHNRVTQIVILDADLGDLAYENIIGRFRRWDQPQAEGYFAGIFQQVLEERFREAAAERGSYDAYVSFRTQLSTIAPHVDPYASARAPASPEVVQLLRKGLALRGVYFDATELGHIQARTALYLLELYATLQHPERRVALDAIFARGTRQLVALRNAPVLLVPLRPYQEEFLEKWLEGPSASIVEMATGTGKTVLGLGALATLAREKTRGEFRALITAPSHAICDQWRTEMRNKLGIGITKGDYVAPNIRIEVRTIQSLANRDPASFSTYDLLIVDEVHHAAGPEWRKATRVPARRKLGLSATIPGESRLAVLEDELGPVIASLSLGEARDRGILPEFRWIIHPVELSPSEATEFRRQSDQIRDLFQKVRDKAITHATLREIAQKSKGRFRYQPLETIGDLLRAYEWATLTKVHRPDDWITLFGLVQARQWISHRSIPKMQTALTLIQPSIEHAKCMVTTMDIETAETLAAKLPPELTFVVHSQIKREEVRRQLDAFKAAPRGALIAPKLLDEGIDVPDASIGFNVAGTKSRIQLIQRLGRILRPIPGKKPVFHHFVTLPPKDVYLEGVDDVAYVEDLLWIHELGRAIGTKPEFATPQIDADFLQAVQESGYRAHAKRLAQPSAEIEIPGGSIRFEQVLESITPNAAAAMLPHLEGETLDETAWRRLTEAAEPHGIPPGFWWLFARFRDEPKTLRELLEPLAEEAEPPEETPSRPPVTPTPLPAPTSAPPEPPVSAPTPPPLANASLEAQAVRERASVETAAACQPPPRRVPILPPTPPAAPPQEPEGAELEDDDWPRPRRGHKPNVTLPVFDVKVARSILDNTLTMMVVEPDDYLAPVGSLMFGMTRSEADIMHVQATRLGGFYTLLWQDPDPEDGGADAVFRRKLRQVLFEEDPCAWLARLTAQAGATRVGPVAKRWKWTLSIQDQTHILTPEQASVWLAFAIRESARAAEAAGAASPRPPSGAPSKGVQP